jgi:hypothetical protein
MIDDAASVVAALAGMISAIVAAQALLAVKRQIAAADRTTEATLFVTINSEWTKVYPIYRSVLLAPINWDEFRRHTDLDVFMNSEYWQGVRPIFAFYEFLGSCVETGLVRKDLVFKLVNVNARLWEKYEPLIREMRALGKYPDLYRRWESLVALRRVSEV